MPQRANESNSPKFFKRYPESKVYAKREVVVINIVGLSDIRVANKVCEYRDSCPNHSLSLVFLRVRAHLNGDFYFFQFVFFCFFF